MYKLVLLDRDGVINRDLATGVLRLEDFEILPGVIEAISQLNKAQIKTAIVTNQACVGRGELSQMSLERIHTKLFDDLKKQGTRVDAIYVCTDVNISPNDRRKPAPGMLLEAMDFFQVHGSDTIMIGDDLRDLQAAKAAGCDSCLVTTGKGEQTQSHKDFHQYTPKVIAKNLLEATAFILGTL